jgi:7-carboxy-7-deazaguanine synthase
VLKNQQAPLARVKGDGASLLVHSIFNTIQGEGPHAGRAAIFIRLAGCNLQCPLCDTEYTEGAQERRIDWLIHDIQDAAVSNLLVITGGEPFRQPITSFVDGMLDAGYEVQIETNGKLPIDDPERWTPPQPARLKIVVSPKTATIDPFVAKIAAAYKYVISAGAISSTDGLPISALDHPLKDGFHIARPPDGWQGAIYIQPCDEQDEHRNAAHMAAAVAAVTDFGDPRRRLCLQMHKYANLP